MAAFAAKSYGMIQQLPSAYRSVGAAGVRGLVTPIFSDRIVVINPPTIRSHFAELFSHIATKLTCLRQPLFLRSNYGPVH